MHHPLASSRAPGIVIPRARRCRPSFTHRIRGSGRTLARILAVVCLWLPTAGIVEVLAAAEPEPAKLARVEMTPKLEVLNQQIAANAEDPQAYANRGYTLALLGRKDEARADIQRSIALKDNGPTHNRAGWAYFNLGDYAEALREFETAAKFSNYRSHYDYYSLVLGYWGTGNTKEALENYQLAVERDPRFGEYKTVNERTAEWTPQERRAIHEIYVLWSKAWKP